MKIYRFQNFKYLIMTPNIFYHQYSNKWPQATLLTLVKLSISYKLWIPVISKISWDIVNSRQPKSKCFLRSWLSKIFVSLLTFFLPSNSSMTLVLLWGLHHLRKLYFAFMSLNSRLDKYNCFLRSWLIIFFFSHLTVIFK